MGPKRKYTRLYSREYLAFGFIESPVDKLMPMCLLCHKSFSNEAMKPSRLVEHLGTKHPDKKDKPMEFFQNIAEQFKKRSTLPSMFHKSTQMNRDGLIASYRISELIAKSGCAHTIGEQLLIPCFQEMISTMMHQDPSNVLRNLPLSNDTVRRRIDEMACDVEKHLISTLQTRSFSLQIDESTITDNDALLMAYVRYFDDNNVLQEEMLFADKLITDTKGTSIFATVKSYFEKNNISLTNIIACATDGAPSMVGRYRGFIALLKEKAPNVRCIHCIIHRQHLVAKNMSPSLHSSLNITVNAINKIKSNAKNERLFRQLCQDSDEEHVRLLLHTSVRWLSKGQCLIRFAELYESVQQFLESEKEFSLYHQVREVKNHVFYLADIFTKLNDVNLHLQGRIMTLIECKKVVCLFIDKLKLFKRNVIQKELHQFPVLSSIKDVLTEIDLDIFSKHLTTLQKDMENRFEDILSLEVSAWMEMPFNTDVNDVEVICQEELLQLKYDTESKANFNKGGYLLLWQNKKMPHLYPNLWNRISSLLIPFPTSYLVESGFSVVNHILTKERNCLKISDRGDLRLFLTKIKPNIESLVNQHQPQGSH